MLLARWPRPKHSNDRAMTENALRCCLLISSAFCGLVGCDCAGRVALSSSSPWQRSRRTFVGWPSSPAGRHRWRSQLWREVSGSAVAALTVSAQRQLPRND